MLLNLGDFTFTAPGQRNGPRECTTPTNRIVTRADESGAPLLERVET